ncbi:MAG: dihydropteroate synthase [Verrucomicrobiae bacterium]|nr:dihydropteroate synthase [Verrucomicrobiae bacterium]
MGIVNVTPDSFSDGGQFGDAEQAVAHGLELVRQGATILDIGGESSRPGAAPVSESEELSRVIPVITALARQTTVPLSIDTMKPAVARAALRAGASLVNDVGASCAAAEMWQLVAETGAGYVAMHMQGLPRTMQLHPVYDDVVKEVGAFFEERLKRVEAVGVAAEQIVFDVGIGFGKSVTHNLQLLSALPGFTKLPRPMALGVSRKSFIGALTGATVDERLPGSLACAALAVAAGVQIIRTHDVAETVQAVRLAEAIRELR